MDERVRSFRQRFTPWFAIAAISLVVLSPSHGHAQDTPTSAADELFELGDLEAARQAYQQTVEAGGNTPNSLALAYRRLGVLAAIVNDSEQATQWFDRSLALDASQEAPEALAPSQRSLFVSVQERRQGETGELMATHDSEVGHAVLQLTSRRLPAAWVHQYRVTAGSWSELSEDGLFQLGEEAFAGSDEISVDCEALDAHGNVLVVVTAHLSRRRVIPPVVEMPSHPRRGLWIGLAILAAAGITAAIIIPLSLSGDDTSSYGMPVIQWP